MQRYGMSILYVALAFATKAGLDAFVPQNPIFLPFTAAAAAAAWWYGLGPALVALALGAGLTAYHFLPTTHDVLRARYGESLPLLAFVVESGVAVWLVDRLRVSRWRGETARGRQRQLVDAATDQGGVLLDAAGGVGSWNTGAERIGGYSAGEVMDRPRSNCCPTPSSDLSGPGEGPPRPAGPGRVEGEGWGESEDAGLYSARVTTTPPRDCRGRPDGNAQVVADLTLGRDEEPLGEGRDWCWDAFEQAALGIAYVTPDNRCLHVNAALCRIVGFDNYELEGSRLAELTHPDDRVAESALVDRLLAAEIPGYQIEERYVRKDGTVVWVDVIASAVRGPAGAIRAVTVVVQDATGRKRVEDALRVSERRLQLFTDALPALAAYVGPDQRYQFANAAHVRWCGVSKQGCTGRHVREVLGEDSYAALKGTIESALSGRPGDFEARVTHLAAGTRDVHVYQVPDRDESGEVVGIGLLVVDTTAQRAAERAARDCDACLRAIVDTATDAIITIDSGGRIDSFNAAAERMFGAPAAEVIGRNVSTIMASPYREEHDSYLARHLRTGEKRLIGTVREGVARRKDGTTFPVEISVSEIDHSRRFTGILRDVSRRHELEREVLDASALEQQRIGFELHDGVGQELTGLGLMSSALAQQLCDQSPELAGLADHIAAGLAEAHAHVRELSRGLVPVAVGPEGLRAALDDLVARTSRQSCIKFTLHTVGPTGSADPDTATHLYRVAQEAVSNALRHSQAKHVWLTLQGTAASLTMEVRDDGVGISRRADDRAGLGIRLMRYRCGVLGGTLTIRPAEPAGTVVRCEVPRRRDDGQE